MYTARPASGRQVEADTAVKTMVSGTPSARPDSPAKLERMSLRTTPDWPSTLGPLDPSPGNGPAVSSGILVLQLELPDVVVDVVEVVALGAVSEPAQPANCSTPTPAPSRAAIRKRLLRLIATPVARRSRCRPPKSS